jgi:hypothetical protein
MDIVQLFEVTIGSKIALSDKTMTIRAANGETIKIPHLTVDRHDGMYIVCKYEETEFNIKAWEVVKVLEWAKVNKDGTN